MNDIFEFRRGKSPLLVSFPHDGTAVPEEIMARFTDAARELRDTDWHVAELYGFAREMDVSFIRARFSRYVVDLNRPPERSPLYPGKFETAICPLSCFSMDPVYEPGKEPGDEEVAERTRVYWRPYHDHVRSELRRLKSLHGFAVLLDAHTVAGRVPSLFPGELPHLNFGTNGGVSCAPEVADAAMALARTRPEYSSVLDGRFRGGYITRHYGRPAEDLHAIQLEINQDIYLRAGKFEIDDHKADRLRGFLRQLVERFMDLGLAGTDSI